jgi:GGDEF-like domain
VPAAVARAAEKIDALAGHATLATHIGGNLLVVRPVTRGGTAPDALDGQELVRGFAGHLRRLIGERTGTQVRVAFGRVGTGARGVASSYREARTALALGRRVDVPPIAGYDELRIFVALSDLADSENGRTFAGEVRRGVCAPSRTGSEGGAPAGIGAWAPEPVRGPATDAPPPRRPGSPPAPNPALTHRFCWRRTGSGRCVGTATGA